jgi:hypothetical protein
MNLPVKKKCFHSPDDRQLVGKDRDHVCRVVGNERVYINDWQRRTMITRN